MAIFASHTKTGISWIAESVALFKQAPAKWIWLSMVYLSIFVFAPSIPGLQLFAFVTIFVWPIFIVIAMRLYRNAEFKKEESFSMVMQLIQPKMRQLLLLGLVSFIYFIFVSLVLGSELQALTVLAQKQATLSEADMLRAISETMLPLLLKLTLLFIPLMMAVWFAPMLIAFNDYPVMKALKSSIAGSLQYMLAMTVAWALLTAGIVGMMFIAGLITGFLALAAPGFAQSLMTLTMFTCLLLSIAMTLAFQYVSYRDVFRAA